MRQVEARTFLELTINQYLRWKPHIESSLQMRRNSYAIFNKVKPFLSNKSLFVIQFFGK